MLAAHQHRTAAGAFALLVLIYLWPVLVGGGTLAPLAEMYHLAPWMTVAPADIERYVNQSLTDVPLSYYPWDFLARELIHAGTFPAWNTHAFAGTPFFANPEVAWLSPFSLPLWIFPLNYGLGVAAALKLWAAAFGTYLLARELRLGFWPGLLAGVAFGLCAFNTTWISYGVFVSVAAMLPWAIWLIERIVRRGRPADGLALAGVAAVVLTGGHPGAQVHVLGAAVLYALVRAAAIADVVRRDRLRRIVLVGAGLVLGVLLTAVVLLPAQQAAVDSAGSVARQGGGIETFIGGQMPYGVLRTVLFPDWWGRTSELILGPANYNERTFYVGSVAFVLAVVALASSGAWRRKAPFVLLAVLGAGAAVRAPGLQALLDHVPPFDRVQNHRMALWLQFGLALLAGFGLQALLDVPRPAQRTWLVVGASALVGIVALGTLDLGAGTVPDGVRYMVHRSWTATAETLAFATIGWWLVFVAVLAGLLLLAHRRPDRLTLVGGLVVLVAALDMLHFANGYQPMGPASKIVPPRTPAIAFLQRHADDGRIAGTELTLAQDWSTIYGLRDGRGYDAPQPSLRFHRLWQLLNRAQPLHTAYIYDGISRPGLQVLGLLGVRYLVTPPEAGPPVGGMPQLYAGRDARVFGNPLAMPRAIVASRVRIATDEDAEIAGVAEGFDPRRDAVVRRDELGAAAASLPAHGGAGTVRIVADENSRVGLRATLERPGVVVLGDAWAPGWSVRVDGRPARALQTDVVLRGVVVPAGSHEIVWTYRVPGLRAGAALSLLGLLAALGWGAWIAVGARRRGARGAA